MSASPLGMRFRSLNEWLAWQETLHIREIDLGLDRCRLVAKRMGLSPPAYPVITVGGTNGKGSSVAMLDAILSAAGYKVARYTSPHLLRYNERVRIAGRAVGDRELCGAFQHVDAARGDVSLTYFEFGTLAALAIFQQTELDVAVLEVGLGGRLDAVNLVDADVALLTAIGIDHVEWLGNDRATIAREKAGIFRRGRPAVCSDPRPPATLSEQAERLGARLCLLGRDYRIEVHGERWSWQGSAGAYQALPRPNLRGDYQFHNAAGALMVLQCIAGRLPVREEAVRRGLSEVQLDGRFQVIPGPVEYILDVAHNPHAAEALARTLRQRHAVGKTHVLAGMLKDKDCQGFFRQLAELADHWHVTDLTGSRAASAHQLTQALNECGVTRPVLSYSSVGEALAGVEALVAPGDRVLVTGSFLTVAGAMRSFAAGGPRFP